MRNVDLSGAQKVGAEGARKKKFSIDSKKDEWSSLEKEKVARLSAGALLDFLKVTTWTSTTRQKRIKTKLFIYFFSLLKMTFIHWKFKIIFHYVQVVSLQQHNFK